MSAPSQTCGATQRDHNAYIALRLSVCFYTNVLFENSAKKHGLVVGNFTVQEKLHFLHGQKVHVKGVAYQGAQLITNDTFVTMNNLLCFVQKQ
jgi:hypothetical protein